MILFALLSIQPFFRIGHPGFHIGRIEGNESGDKQLDSIFHELSGKNFKRV